MKVEKKMFKEAKYYIEDSTCWVFFPEELKFNEKPFDTVGISEDGIHFFLKDKFFINGRPFMQHLVHKEHLDCEPIVRIGGASWGDE